MEQAQAFAQFLHVDAARCGTWGNLTRTGNHDAGCGVITRVTWCAKTITRVRRGMCDERMAVGSWPSGDGDPLPLLRCNDEFGAFHV